MSLITASRRFSTTSLTTAEEAGYHAGHVAIYLRHLSLRCVHRRCALSPRTQTRTAADERQRAMWRVRQRCDILSTSTFRRRVLMIDASDECRSSLRQSPMLKRCYRRTLSADDHQALIRQVRGTHALSVQKRTTTVSDDYAPGAV